MTFKGFDLKYPEYEVITPQTKLKFSFRSLNVQEEEHMKGSLVTPAKVTEHLNKCLYESLVSKPTSIKDFDSFLKSVTLKDRDALLYGLYHITYEEIREYDVTCGSCRKEYPVTVNASDTFNFLAYPGNDILSKKVKIALPVSEGVSAYVKQPTLYDEQSIINNLSNRPGSTVDLLSETLIVDSFEQDVEKITKPIVYSDRVDILDAYMTLPAKDKRAIYDGYTETFGQYGVWLKMRSFCPTCGFDEVIDINIGLFLFDLIIYREFDTVLDLVQNYF